MAAAIPAGSAVISIMSNWSAFNDSIGKNLGKARAAFMSHMASINEAAKKFALGGAAALAGVGIAVNAAAEQQTTAARTRAIFGEGAEDMMRWAESFEESTGKGASTMLALANSTGLFLENLGLSEEQSKGLSKTLAGIAVDVAAFNKADLGETMEALRKGLSGEGKGLKGLGLSINSDKIAELAKARGMLGAGGAFGDLSEQQKAGLALEVIVSQTAKMRGAAGEAKREFSQAFATAKEAAGDFLESVGTPLLTKLGDVAFAITGVLRAARRWVDANPGTVQAVALATVSVTALAASVYGLSLAFGVLAPVAAGVASVFTVIGLGSGVAGAGVVALGGYLLYASGAFKSLGEIAGQTWGGIVTALQSGDLEAAARIALAGLNLAFVEVTGKIKQAWAWLWADVKLGFVEAELAFREAWVGIKGFVAENVTEPVGGVWQAMIDRMTVGLIELTSGAKEAQQRLILFEQAKAGRETPEQRKVQREQDATAEMIAARKVAQASRDAIAKEIDRDTARARDEAVAATKIARAAFQRTLAPVEDNAAALKLKGEREGRAKASEDASSAAAMAKALSQGGAAKAAERMPFYSGFAGGIASLQLAGGDKALKAADRTAEATETIAGEAAAQTEELRAIRREVADGAVFA